MTIVIYNYYCTYALYIIVINTNYYKINVFVLMLLIYTKVHIAFVVFVLYGVNCLLIFISFMYASVFL
jgi:hypothetical protein